MRSPDKTTRHRLRPALALALCCTPLLADAETLGFAGFEAGKGQGYAYVGSLSSLPGSELGNGWLWRNWLDGLKYEYEANGTIKARSVAYTPALVHQNAWDRGSFGISIGARIASTHLSPDDPANENRGSRVTVPLQLDVDYRVSPRTAIAAIASMEVNTGSYWSRVRMLHGLDQGIAIGPELIWKGSHEFRAQQLDLVVGNMKLSGRAQMAVKVGHVRQDGRGRGGYAGLEFVQSFR